MNREKTVPDAKSTGFTCAVVFAFALQLDVAAQQKQPESVISTVIFRRYIEHGWKYPGYLELHQTGPDPFSNHRECLPTILNPGNPNRVNVHELFRGELRGLTLDISRSK